VKINNTVLVVMKDDISTILRDRRTHARLEQLLDLKNDFVLVFLQCFHCTVGGFCDQRPPAV